MILVTGGAGYVGSHVANLLSTQGYKVIVFDNLSTGFTDALFNSEKIVVADLADYSAINAVMQQFPIEAVMHFAGSVVVPESVIDPAKYYMNNTINTLNLLRACIQNKIKHIVYSSTAAVYGSPASGVANEKMQPAPTSPYGSSKWMGEQMLHDIAVAHEMNFVCLRYFNVAGADSTGRNGQRSSTATHLIKVACQAALGLREYVAIYGTDYATPDGTGVRDYVHIEDLASAHLCALHHLLAGKPSTTLNVGYGKGASVREVIDCVKEISGRDFPVVSVARRPGDPAKLVAQNDKISTMFSWDPQCNDLSQIIADAWRWEKILNSTTIMA